MHVLDPYAVPGPDRKAQLHCHTTGSDGKHAPEAVVERYRAAGFSFLAITDHDVVTEAAHLSDTGFCVVSGVEMTVAKPFRPLGPHLGCLMVHTLPQGKDPATVLRAVEERGGLAGLNHPSWTGNLWTGRWTPRRALGLRGYRFVEVYNPHSDPDRDTRIWVEAARAHGPHHPVFPVASDDFHHEGQFGKGWVVVRAQEVAVQSLRQALLRGAVYATTGPVARFGVKDGVVTVETDASRLRFYDAAGHLKLEVRRGMAEYEPVALDGFVRVECLGRASGRAWSACFWVVDA